MTENQTERQIRNARERFDRELHTGSYNAIHSNEEHLKNLVSLLDMRPDSCCLDLGTGNGYLAFAIAEEYPEASVFGLDIAENAIIRNREIAMEKGLTNIFFSSYDGRHFPFTEDAFDRVISRYALHHFPDINFTAEEIHRVLQPQGTFLYSDPKRDSRDRKDFINAFQKLKQDGHVAFLKEKELLRIFREAGFDDEKSFASRVRFPREYSPEYKSLLARARRKMKRIHEIEVTHETVSISVAVMNILFRKK